MYWEIKSKYYSIIIRVNYKKINFYYIQMYFEKCLKSTWNYRGRRYERRARFTPLRRVDGSTSGRTGLRQASNRGKPMFPLAQRTIRAAVHAVGYISSSIYSCIYDNFLLIFYLSSDVVHFYIIIFIYFLTFDTYNNKIRLWFQFPNVTD